MAQLIHRSGWLNRMPQNPAMRRLDQPEHLSRVLRGKANLGLRRRGLTHGFVVRMLERGNSDRPKLLESVVETLRGRRLSAKQGRSVAAAYALATRRLQTCDSPADRAEILRERDRQPTSQPAAIVF
jgi:hypothetical protein